MVYLSEGKKTNPSGVESTGARRERSTRWTFASVLRCAFIHGKLRLYFRTEKMLSACLFLSLHLKQFQAWIPPLFIHIEHFCTLLLNLFSLLMFWKTSRHFLNTPSNHTILHTLRFSKKKKSLCLNSLNRLFFNHYVKHIIFAMFC